MMDVSYLAATAAVLATAFGYGFYKDTYGNKSDDTSSDYRPMHKKASDEEREKPEPLYELYSASLFTHRALKDLYIKDVLRDQYPYQEPWYTTMVGVLGLLDELQNSMIRFPSSEPYVFGNDAMTITTINVRDITLLTCQQLEYKFNPHLKLASWLFYIGMLDEFSELSEIPDETDSHSILPIRRVLTVAHYCLIDLESYDRRAIVKMIRDFWEDTSDFITLKEMLTMADKFNLFRTQAQFVNQGSEVIPYPIGYQFKRFKTRRATMKEHKKW